MNSWLRTVFGQEIICFDNVSGRMWAGGRVGGVRVFSCAIFSERDVFIIVVDGFSCGCFRFAKTAVIVSGVINLFRAISTERELRMPLFCFRSGQELIRDKLLSFGMRNLKWSLEAYRFRCWSDFTIYLVLRTGKFRQA